MLAETTVSWHSHSFTVEAAKGPCWYVATHAVWIRMNSKVSARG